MNKRTAKRLLLEQKEKLDDVKNRDEHWIRHTLSLIIQIFGEGSIEHRYFLQFSFSIQYSPGQATFVTAALGNIKITDVKQFLQNCAETLDIHDTSNEESLNFLSKWSPPELWGAIGGVALTLFSIGFFFGTLSSSNKIDRLEVETAKLKDSLILAPMRNKGTDQLADTISASKGRPKK
jgi:hypothetical protein